MVHIEILLCIKFFARFILKASSPPCGPIDNTSMCIKNMENVFCLIFDRQVLKSEYINKME